MRSRPIIDLSRFREGRNAVVQCHGALLPIAGKGDLIPCLTQQEAPVLVNGGDSK